MRELFTNPKHNFLETEKTLNATPSYINTVNLFLYIDYSQYLCIRLKISAQV